MRILSFIVFFLFLGAFFIISEDNIDLKQDSGVKDFGNLYYEWIVSLFDNSKQIAGYVIKAEWLPDEGFLNTSRTIR